MNTNPFVRNREERVRIFKYSFTILMTFQIAITVKVAMGESPYWLLTWLITALMVLAYIRDRKLLAKEKG